MPDSEAFKLILQGGSFGLLAIGVVWLLFWFAPRLQGTLEKMTADHRATVEAVQAACKEETRLMLDWLARQMNRRHGKGGTDTHQPLGDQP